MNIEVGDHPFGDEFGLDEFAGTRQLIELGGLVVKAGLVDLTDDDRATIYGALLTVAAKLRGDEGAHALALWKRKGKRAFEAEAELRNDKDPGGTTAGA